MICVSCGVSQVAQSVGDSNAPPSHLPFETLLTRCVKGCCSPTHSKGPSRLELTSRVRREPGLLPSLQSKVHLGLGLVGILYTSFLLVAMSFKDSILP